MLVWMIYPPHFDPNRKYPAILYCEGGPRVQSVNSGVIVGTSSRWLANGYIIVAPKPPWSADPARNGWNKSAGLFRSEHQGLPFPLSTKPKKNLISMKTGSDV